MSDELDFEVSDVGTMRAICAEATFTTPRTADDEQLHLDLWWPDRPLPQVVLTCSRHIQWGASLTPDDARDLADELRRAADECDRARAALKGEARGAR